MQDIDFDEIDRAVSSVTDPIPERDTTPVSPIASREGESVIPTPVSPSPPSSPAVRRSTGRFMDVVHPSSDMRPTRPEAPSAPSLHREEVVGARADIAVAKRPEPAAVASSAFHWPDPIDVANSEPESQPASESVSESRPELTSTPQPAPVEEETPVILSVPEETPSSSPVIEDATPLESPFLSDAKVEKRPLGAFSTNDAPAELPLLEDFPVPSSSTTSEPLKTEVPAPQTKSESTDIPPELDAALLLLDTHSQDEANEAEEVSEPVVVPAEIVAADDIPAGPTSITQQYKEQPSTASQPSGSIYDTEAYHQPLTHPAKKRSGALVIVWIVALILVGSGIGAGIYFVLLPMLG